MCVRVRTCEREGEGGGHGERGSLTGNLESYVRHIKESFGNEASLSLQRLHYGNLEGGLLY